MRWLSISLPSPLPNCYILSYPSLSPAADPGHPPVTVSKFKERMAALDLSINDEENEQIEDEYDVSHVLVYMVG